MEKYVSLTLHLQSCATCLKMEDEVNKAINTTVFKEYGDPGHSKVTKAINFAQENVSN